MAKLEKESERLVSCAIGDILGKDIYINIA